MQKTFKLALCFLSIMLAATRVYALDFIAEYNGTTFSFTTTSDNTCEVSYSLDYYGDVEIPASVTYHSTTYEVTAIGNNAFLLTDIISVSIPTSVIKIGAYAFSGCCYLTSLIIPNSVTSIGEGAFLGCDRLKTVEISNSLDKISRYAFSSCSALDNVVIPNSVISIEDGAFSDCTALNNIDIPNSVITIGYNAFSQCSALTSVVIPNSVTTIGDIAFFCCTSLVSATIPSSVKSFGNQVFCQCENLESFYGDYASADNRCLVINGALVAFAPKNITSYKVDDTVTCIANGAFSLCQYLTSIMLPNTVKTIESHSFSQCWALANVEMSSAVTTIGDCAFFECSSLQSIVIPGAVETIESFAFYDCSSLSSIEIPNSVKTIGDNAFCNCIGLNSLKVDNTDPSNILLGEEVFDGIDFDRCVLYVPVGSKQKYAKSTQWCDFVNIEETDGIAEIEADADKAINVMYYDMQGRMVSHPSANGIYIMRAKTVGGKIVNSKIKF